MSEAIEKVLGMQNIPIFPLPLVLMPYELLPLHIFEPRYQQMLKDIELRRNVFGINLFEPQSEFDEKPAAGTVGCVAEIRQVQPTPDERSNILTFGLVRYRLIEYVDIGTPYFSAEVAFFEDDEEDEGPLNAISDEVFGLFDRVAKAAFKLSGNRGRFPDVPRAAPEQLSFLVAAAFNLDNELKSQFIEMTSTSERLTKLKSILEQAVGQMESNAEIHSVAQTNGHSKKPIDLGE
ncbi:MAG TPA: LON peptidase substrate-binding domain-containing protein [Pyrinomonadaceae bacterium]|nr:LON peptidase substrate-binding domain-containing protein [Pyrinomonadaceae bacterium]